MESLRARSTDPRGLVTGAGLAVVHLGAICAFIPGTFSWSAVAVMLALYYITGAWGITLGFHRTLTHRSLRVRRGLEPILAILGTLALQGGPIEWVATHRAHHANTDREGDPHDIHRGAWWSHMAWLSPSRSSTSSSRARTRSGRWRSASRSSRSAAGRS
jgi:stearoyl-CoA desaturase (delta-9 desaturase)